MTGKQIVVLGLIASLLVACGLIVLGVCNAPMQASKIWFEVAKAGVQLSVITVIGGLVTALLRYLDFAREERRRLNEYQISVLRTITSSYNTIKAVRRVLRTLGLDAPPRSVLTGEDIAEFKSQMKALNTAQLDLERIARELEVHGGAFFSSVELAKDARTVEGYINQVIEDWEKGGHTVLAGSSEPVLDSMPNLNAFLESGGRKKPPIPTFKEGASEPMERLEKAIQSQLLPPKKSAPSAVNR